ncbi:MAG: hypothetical protein MRK02_05610 [Candidatus Scalindua sp.]|nr:hypothetical protein [Candidatus Scalindua sp.]
MAKKGKRNVKQGLVDKKDQERLKKVNEWKSEKKTKAFERLQAISRHPDYEKDYTKLRELDGTFPTIRLQDAYIEQCEKDGSTKEIGDLLLNEEYKKKVSEIEAKVKENELEVIKLRTNMMVKWGVKKLPCLYFPGGVIEPQRQYRDQPSVMLIDSPMREIPNPMKSGELYVKIDLSRNKKDILKDFTEIIKKASDGYARYKKTENADFVKRRHKEHYSLKVDKFDIYDMYHRDRLSFSEIARRVSGYKGNINSDTRLIAVHRAVKRSYQKAESMIQKEGDDAEFRVKELLMRGVNA